MKRALFVLLAGCGMIGTESAFPGPVQSSGVGPFRVAFSTETSVELEERPGAALATGRAVEKSSLAPSGHLFYAAADLLGSPPDRDPELAEGEVDWARFEGRRIYRSAPRADLGFDEGSEVLEASETWEGEGVFDPFLAVVDGRTLLYYAAAGGIGVAEAGDVEGTFTKLPGPILEDARSPALLPDPAGGWLLFYTSSEGLGVATSSDGLSFTVREVDVADLLDGDGDEDTPHELRAASPTAVLATTPTGREVLRVYFEVVFDDGTRALSMIAGEDGVTWERLQGYVFQNADESPAAPGVALREEVTVLYFTMPFEQSDAQTRALVAAVAPAHIELADPPPPAE